MNRLLYAIAFTSDIDQLKGFYRDRLGLRVGADSPYWVSFDFPEGSLALLAVRPEQKREVEMCFGAANVTRQRAVLAARGVEFLDDVREMEFGKVFHLRDPEGNLLSFLEPAAAFDPRVAAAGRAAQQQESAAGGGSGTVATVVEAEPGIANPSLSTIVIHGRDLPALKTYYRDQLGFALTLDTPGWVTFDVGGITLALHPTGVGDGRQPEPRVTPSFTVSNLIDWSDEARARGVHFSTAPIDQDWGLYSAVTDPEGYEVCFCEYAAVPGLEERLAEQFEDDTVPHQIPIRKPIAKKGARAASHVAIRPDYQEPRGGGPKTRTKLKAKAKARAKTKVKARPKPASKPVKSVKPVKATKAAKGAKVRKARGTGPARSRATPKRSADPKRARNRPATGRLKKAERRSGSRKKAATARSSKAKPVKRAVSSRGRRR